MLIFSVSTGYLIGTALWLAVLAAIFALIWRLRRHRFARVGLSLWMLLASVTALELGFAAFYSASDALNFTNVARRWYELNIAPQVSAGLRLGHPLQDLWKPGTERITFVGDSFTFGHGVPRMEDRFSDRIAARLAAAHPGRFAVDNLGVPGHSLNDITAQVGELLRTGYRPRVIVYVWQINDIDRIDRGTWEAAGRLGADRSDFWLIRDTYFLNWLWYRGLLSGRGVRDFFDALRAGYEGPSFGKAMTMLDEMQDACRSAGVELRLVVFPFVHELGDGYSFREAHRHLVEHARQRDLRALDLEPTLSRHANESLMVNSRDAHPNERAHELAADAMAAELLPDLLR